MFSRKATKIDEIFTVNLAICSKFQIDGVVAFLENMLFKELLNRIHSTTTWTDIFYPLPPHLVHVVIE